jgi:integrase
LIVKAVFDDYTAVIEQSDPDTASLLRRFATHLLRHTGITHAVENDVNVRFVGVQAGHSDIRTTMQHYYHAQDRAMVDALNLADTRLCQRFQPTW